MAEWERRAGETTGDDGIESLERRTLDGQPLKPLYTAQNRPAEAWSRPDLPMQERSLALRPESGPAICSLIEAADPSVAGERLGQELNGGADGIWLRLDRIARLGLEASDEPAAGGDGVEVYHGSDLASVLEMFPADAAPAECHLWLDGGANALPLAALWLADCERRERPADSMALHLGADPFAALARDGALPRDLMKLSSEMAALVRFCAGRLPDSSAIGVSTVVYHEAGADAVQELGFAVATLLDYLRRLGDSGLSPVDVASHVSLRLAVGSQVFAEIAKLRAVRCLWRATLGAAGVEAPPAARLHVIGSRRALTRRQPELNLLRGCEQGFAAACGGADAVSLWGFERARGSRHSLARRLARNTGLILRHEGHLGRVEDPAAGSFLVESLTRQLAERGWALAQEIERRGGMGKLLLSGQVARWVEESAARRAGALAGEEAGITGVTDYVLEDPTGERPDAEMTDIPRQPALERLERHRRDWRTLDDDSDYSKHFVVEELLSRARRGATLHELGSRLGGDESSERIDALPPRPDAAPFEEAS